MTTFTNSYIITNRNIPSATSQANIYPLPNDELLFYTAAGAYNDEVTDYTAVGAASTNPPQEFLNALIADLQIAITNKTPQLTVLIHGLGNTFANSINELWAAGTGLQAIGYNGLVISFDWPSFTMFSSFEAYSWTPYSFPPTQTSGTIRGNINGSVGAFANLIQMLLQVQEQAPSIQVNLICHSEGNYMAMLGLNAALAAKTSLMLNQVLLVAADINSGALQLNGSLPYTGQGVPISTLADRVTIYYSINDDVLPVSQQLLGAYHNPSFPNRLGWEGPNSFEDGALPLNTFGVDCAAVIDDSVIQNISQVPPGTTAHSAYFYVPQVLQDWADTMTGTAAGSFVNRTANANAQDGQGYVMTYVPPAAQTVAAG